MKINSEVKDSKGRTWTVTGAVYNSETGKTTYTLMCGWMTRTVTRTEVK